MNSPSVGTHIVASIFAPTFALVQAATEIVWETEKPSRRQECNGCPQGPASSMPKEVEVTLEKLCRAFKYGSMVNVPADQKMNEPKYGTVPSKDMPLVDVNEGVKARVLAGKGWGAVGPMKAQSEIQMIDFELSEGSTTGCFDIADGFDTAILYVYEGKLDKANSSEESIEEGHIVLFDAESEEQRGIELIASSSSNAKAMLFAGKKLKEPIAWHGPIVMNTQFQIQQTFMELRSGKFPPVRVEWDYKRLASKSQAKN